MSLYRNYRTRLINEDWKQSPQWTQDYFDAARRAVLALPPCNKQQTYFVDVAEDSASNRQPNDEPVVSFTLTVIRNPPYTPVPE